MMFFFLMLATVVMATVYGSAILNGTWPFEGMQLADTGIFGDSWGAFTSIFSALGFCGVLWTIKLQRDATKQIELDSRKRDKSEQIRDFENSFFNMLNILQTIIKDMRVGDDGKKINKEGRSVFTYYYSRFKNECIKKEPIEIIAFLDKADFSLKKEMEMLSRFYGYYFRGRSGNLSHYYRFIYNMFKFIHESTLNNSEKKKYANILRAQISNYELLMLCYNGNTRHGLKFKEYFNEYAVFDNLPVDKLVSDVHVLFYDKKAWGENEDALSIFRQALNKGLE